jgi:BirA family transcriptional regulator, biotin operon repressor / biotin---[acetyl-CoA-carboxylase] ligase
MIIFVDNRTMYSRFKILFRDIVSSTNDEIKRVYTCEEDYEFLVICANEQTSGRGQRENKWYSDAGKNLTFSIAWSPLNLDIQKQFYLSKVVSLALLNYLQSKTEDVTIKWPNDIYCSGKKICGILIENSISLDKIKQVVIGIGLNLNQSVFPEELDNATSLFLITNQEWDIKSELNQLLKESESTFELLKRYDYSMIDKLYHENLYQIYRTCEYEDFAGKFSGKIIGTLSAGNLIIEDESGKIRIYQNKEVEFK